LLDANRERRQTAAAEVAQAKLELRELLIRGQSAGMEIADMARRAGVSRDTAHRVLKEAGVMSWRQKQDWAAEVLAGIPGGDYDRNEFRMFVNMLLLKALGANPEDVPRSVEGVLELAAETMRTVRGKGDFEPSYDPRLLALAWPA
jgi:hypothetical protein